MKKLLIIGFALVMMSCAFIACNREHAAEQPYITSAPSSQTPVWNEGDSVPSPRPTPAGTEELSLDGNMSGILYYNLDLFRVDRGSIGFDDEKQEVLFDLFLMSTKYSVESIDRAMGYMEVNFVHPFMPDMIFDACYDVLISETTSDTAVLLDHIYERLLIGMDNVSANTQCEAYRFPLTEKEGKLCVAEESYVMDRFFEENFFAPYIRYFNPETIEGYRAEYPYEIDLVGNKDTLLGGVMEADSLEVTEDNIEIFSSSINTVEGNGNYECTEGFSLDINGDGGKEVVWISSEYGLVIFRNEKAIAASRPDEWMRNWERSAYGTSEFGTYMPAELIIVDSDKADERIEIIVRIRDTGSSEAGGEYYVFSYDGNNSLASKKLLDYGDGKPYTGLMCTGSCLAVETYVNIMGFRYMQINAVIDEELGLTGLDGGGIFSSHTIETIIFNGYADRLANNGLTSAYSESSAVLTMPLSCTKLSLDESDPVTVTLPAGTVLTPISASNKLALSGGGLADTRPIVWTEGSYPSAEDYAARCRSGIITFRTENGDVYSVSVEIVPSRSIDLSALNIGAALATGRYYYPESVYIGGIEQNTLFAPLNYIGYFSYWQRMMQID